MKIKVVGILVCTLLITAVLPAVGNTNVSKTNVMVEVKDHHQEKSILSSKLVTPISLNNIPAPKSMEGKEIPLITNDVFFPADTPVGSTEDDEFHPSLAMDSSGLLFGAYTLHLSILEENIIYAISQDVGTTWENIDIKDLWAVEGVLDYPAVDYWGSENKFVGTFKPSPDDNDGSTEYLLRVDDPTDTETWSLVYYDWTGTYQLNDRESPDIAGYSDVGDATWFYGVMATVIDSEYEGAGYVPADDVACLCFPNYDEEGSEWNWWISWDSDCYDNCAHACIDIDRSNGMMFAAWDYFNESAPEKGRDIFLASADVHDWWAEEWNLDFSLLGGSEENTFPDVAADKDYVYIVMQADSASPGNQDIICYYSHDSGENWDTSVVADDSGKDEMYPSIVADGEEAICIFTSDGDLIISRTDDGGVTWSTPEKKVIGSVSMEYRTALVTTAGHTFWTDTRKDNKDIYYESGEAPSKPSTPEGPTSGKTGQSLTYSTSSVDPNGDDVSYGWDWDGNSVVDEWTDFNPSGAPVSISHTWNADFTGDIKVKAKNTNDDESPWSDPLSVSIPKNKAINSYSWLQILLENHPCLLPILRYLLGI